MILGESLDSVVARNKAKDQTLGKKFAWWPQKLDNGQVAWLTTVWYCHVAGKFYTQLGRYYYKSFNDLPQHVKKYPIYNPITQSQKD